MSVIKEGIFFTDEIIAFFILFEDSILSTVLTIQFLYPGNGNFISAFKNRQFG